MPNAKGSLLIDVVRYLRRERAAAEVALPAALRPYLNEWIQPSKWYPEADYHGLLHALAALRGITPLELYTQNGQITAEIHMQSFYGGLLNQGIRPEQIAARTGTLWSTQHDTGVMTFRVDAERRADLELVGYEHASIEMCAGLTGYTQATLQLSGLAEVLVEKRDCVAAGAKLCRWRCTWA